MSRSPLVFTLALFLTAAGFAGETIWIAERGSALENRS